MRLHSGGGIGGGIESGWCRGRGGRGIQETSAAMCQCAQLSMRHSQFKFMSFLNETSLTRKTEP